MAFHISSLISSLYKPQSRHLMLSGINQEIFLRHWGTPEFNINIDNLREYIKLDFLPLDIDSLKDETLIAWIYEKMDIFILFRKGKLIAHFKWSELREKFKRSKVEVDSEGVKKTSDFMAKTLSLFT